MAKSLKPKLEDFNFAKDGAARIDIEGVDGELYEKDGCIWWKMPNEEEASFRAMEEKDTTYGRFPFARRLLTREEETQADTATVIGKLDESAQEAFSRHEPIHIVFYPKIRKSGEWLRFPKEVERFIPAIAPILMTERRNLPVPELWDYVSPSIRISCNDVEPGKNARVVEYTRPDARGIHSWHRHLDRVSDQALSDGNKMVMGEYVLTDEFPTVVTNGFEEVTDDPNRQKELEDTHIILNAPGARKVRAARDMVTSFPHHIVHISPLTYHNSQQNETDETKFRNFMRIFNKVTVADMKAFKHDHPDLYRDLSSERPKGMEIDASIR